MKKSILLLDTETADLSGSVYDVGYVITDKKGRISVERNWLVEEIFTDADKMMGAFYAKKLFTHYAPMLQAGTIEMVRWIEIVDQIREDCFDHNVNVLAAYNLAFDIRVMKSTHKMLGFERPIFDPALVAPVDLLCIWRFACEAKLNTRLYKDVARQQGWISEAGNIKTGAENAYRFCSGDFGFIEDHTALSDALIENEILKRCFAQKKKIPYGHIADKYASQPWRIVNAQ